MASVAVRTAHRPHTSRMVSRMGNSLNTATLMVPTCPSLVGVTVVMVVMVVMVVTVVRVTCRQGRGG